MSHTPQTYPSQNFAHTNSEATTARWQSIREHLQTVAIGAGERWKSVAKYSRMGLERYANAGLLAGWLHDVGKYRKEFQAMLRGQHPSNEHTYHKQAGAAKAAIANHAPVAFAIAGHHGGMPDSSDLRNAVAGPSGLRIANEVWAVAVSENPELSSLDWCLDQKTPRLQTEMLSRVVFSCLVDADWDDTTQYHRRMRGLAPEPDSPTLDTIGWLNSVKNYIESLPIASFDENVTQVRTTVLKACLKAAEMPPGIFTLTVPTGGGKTLSGVAFALSHAEVNGLCRIVYVAPYLSIIDQNARVIRKALGLADDAAELFAHHSLAESEDGDNHERTDEGHGIRRAESWDAPFVVTTNVQFFESLFSNKPARCRKLHNLAGSVILLDECQTIPPGLLEPTCQMLRMLCETLGCTIVLCTATQPVFNHERIPAASRLEAVEICSPELRLFDRLCRVELYWPVSDTALNWKQVAKEMQGNSGHRQAALTIVNSRRAARELFVELQSYRRDGLFHLSTSMCAAHRMKVLDEVRTRLTDKRPCFLVSTQLIEAGVDVDFPLVMREIAPLEAIIQAAGRCNREGRMPWVDGKPGGRTVVFRSVAAREDPRKYFPNDDWYKKGLSTLETNFLAAGHEPKIDAPADLQAYFTRLYFSGELDANLIGPDRLNLNFATVANKYKLIRDESVPVVVATWDRHREAVNNLLDKIRSDPSRANFRALAPYQINLRRHELQKAGSLVARPIENIDLACWFGPYDDDLGMSADNTDVLMIV